MDQTEMYNVRCDIARGEMNSLRNAIEGITIMLEDSRRE